MKAPTPEEVLPLTYAESLRLLHELQVQQVELTAQNAELLQARDKAETDREKYTDLYDFAPIGYFNLDDNGKITAANLSGATLLGVERSRLIGQHFELCVSEKDRAAFTIFLATISTKPGKEVCEVTLRSRDESPLFVQIEATRSASGQECRLALIDITERKRVERKNVAYQNRLRFMGAEILLIEERERRQLATTLHDQIGQVLALAKIKLGALQAADSAEECRRSADGIRELLEQAIASSRTLTFELSPPILYELGFESAVQALCERFQLQHGLHIEFVTDRQPKPLADDMRIILFRAVRELLVNIVKHAQTRNVQVSCQRSNRKIVIVVADDGIGFEPSTSVSPAPGANGFGLFSNRERLHHLGGEMTIDATPGRGTRVILAAELQEKESSEEGIAP